MRCDLGWRSAYGVDKRLHRVDMFLETVCRFLALPVNQLVLGVIVCEYAVPIGIVPAVEVEIVHCREVALDLIILHEWPLSSPDQHIPARSSVGRALRHLT